MIDTYVLPGDGLFPEGITEDPDGRTFYVSSSRKGTLFRGTTDRADLEVWQPAGADGRTGALGMTVDGHGRLLVCGFRTGHLFAYDLATGELVARRTVPGDKVLLNDIVVAGGHAYVTDSERPVLWRWPVGAEIGELEEWLTVPDPGALPYLNGIVAVHDGATLLVAAQGTEVLWRIDVATGAAERVELGGPLAADGMVVADGALFTCDNVELPDGTVEYAVSQVALSADARTGKVTRRWVRSAADTPTTIAYLGGRILQVNSQFGAERAGTATTPFTVRALDVTDSH
ncbi:hypothetical protein Lfu02_09180 [Longispora fulva]|uniref:Cu-Zn family superoxide dismutase n=1 Tax=Longispora fulva TaxID=619741 RepID=A0A8J7G982_9ACTN|nr:SMP-30/gluconolactonase/LRE family protein [Longispora fulva]MBG6135220.1 Cu-Zn family superoxide dismutase [Longispora fulva]GIG56546.1 hypothetical protein Lfu02_09180 [Longispora fulva]